MNNQLNQLIPSPNHHLKPQTHSLHSSGLCFERLDVTTTQILLQGQLRPHPRRFHSLCNRFLHLRGAAQVWSLWGGSGRRFPHFPESRREVLLKWKRVWKTDLGWFSLGGGFVLGEGNVVEELVEESNDRAPNELHGCSTLTGGGMRAALTPRGREGGWPIGKRYPTLRAT